MTNQNSNQGVFKKFTSLSVSLMQKYLPDPYIFCAGLTFLVFLGTLIFTRQSPMRIIGHWTNGFWSLLAFSMQMALVLVLGHSMASSKFFKSFIIKDCIFINFWKTSYSGSKLGFCSGLCS